MTRRSLLWITAVAVALGTVAWSPSPSGAAAVVPLDWTVTIDPYDGAVAARDVPVTGTVQAPIGRTPETVKVELVPTFSECGTTPLSSTVEPDGGRYRAVVATRCNGPYEIRVTAEDGFGPSRPTSGSVGVAAAPAQPSPPLADFDGTSVRTTLPPASDRDAAGWIMIANGTAVATVGPGTPAVDLPAEYSNAALQLKALRWGAEGPGKAPVASVASSESQPASSGPRATDPQGSIPDGPPASRPPAPPGAGGGGARPPTGTTPPTATTRVPSRGTGSDATLPDGYSDELPYGVPDDAFVPGESSSSPSSTDAEETASGTSPAGLVRTSEKRRPGLVAPFALGLMMITIAAHIAWYLRRSKPPTGGGQVSLP